MIQTKTKIFSLLLLFLCTFAYGQMEQYSYKCEIIGVSGQWHKLMLPDEIFGKISPDLDDIRIFGISQTNDTIEAPYLLQLTAEKSINKEISFKTINMSKNDKGYYFTFEIPTSETINQIKLDFKQINFDWYCKLEGSNNLNNWFTIVDKYRILSIKNENTDFQFNLLAIQNSNYRFYRLLIDSKEKPELNSASISQQETTAATYRNYPIKKFIRFENKKTKQTEIDVELKKPVPASFIKVDIKNSFDYYRTITIKYLTDSTKTEKGWLYNYSTLTSGTLNSIDNKGFTFSSIIVQKLKIIIDNNDNQPLVIDSIRVKGYEHVLVVRFDEKATYYLTYGKKAADSPIYDIDRFVDKLPAELTELKMGVEQLIEKRKTINAEPLFKNNLWLWTIMFLIILVLGWFSIKMLRKE